MDIAGDIDIRIYGAQVADPSLLTDYYWGGSRDSGVGGFMCLTENGAPRLLWVDSGGTSRSLTGTADIPYGPNQIQWLRWALDVDNGGSDAEFKSYTGGQDTTPVWTQLGDTKLFGATTDLGVHNDPVVLGNLTAAGSSEMLDGQVKQFLVYDGIDGTLAIHFNADSFHLGAATGDTAVSVTGETWTINGGGVTVRGHDDLLLP